MVEVPNFEVDNSISNVSLCATHKISKYLFQELSGEISYNRFGHKLREN